MHLINCRKVELMALSPDMRVFGPHCDVLCKQRKVSGKKLSDDDADLVIFHDDQLTLGIDLQVKHFKLRPRIVGLQGSLVPMEALIGVSSLQQVLECG